MTNFKWLASLVLTATIAPALPAEPHCPGNVASVPFRLVNRQQVIVAVSVNHSGPYNFLLDTGTEITMVDPALAAELHLITQDSAVVAGVGFLASAPFAQLDLLESATNVSFLFNTARYMPLELLARTSLLGGGLDRAQRPVSTMPLQDLQIGSLEFPEVSFFTFADSSEGLSRTSSYDGLLALGLFRRVFISHTHH